MTSSPRSLAVRSPGMHRRASVRSKLVAVAATAVLAVAVAGAQLSGAPTAQASSRAGSDTGFAIPFSGPSRYEGMAPTKATNPSQVNQPLGQPRADELAVRLGLDKAHTLTREQYLEFVSGGGVGGRVDAAKLVDASVAILTNTTGRPLISLVDGVPTPSVLGSYGLFVNPQGLLESPANKDAATRQINTLLAPGGYLNTWMRANGATRTLVMLYRSPYLVEAAYGYFAQQQSGAAQLVTNTKGGVTTTVGMSMAPALWLVNFILIYVLNPELAASMPAYWTPIPPTVVNAIKASLTGQVPYSQYRNAFP
jgi:hypothetical protein